MESDVEKLLGFVGEMLAHVGDSGGQEYYWRIISGDSANAFSDEKNTTRFSTCCCLDLHLPRQLCVMALPYLALGKPLSQRRVSDYLRAYGNAVNDTSESVGEAVCQ